MPIKGLIHLIEDQPDLRIRLTSRLRDSGFVVVVYDDAAPFFDVLPRLSPGCVVANIRLPGANGLDLLRRVKASGRALGVVLVTGKTDVPLAVEAMKLGAWDFFQEPVDLDQLVSAVDSALDRAASLAESHDLMRHMTSLTARERQVFDGLVRGHSNKVIAQELSISPRTVEIYRANVMLKLGVDSLSGLVRLAVKAGVA